MNVHKFDINVIKPTPLDMEMVEVTACTFDIALDKLSEAVHNIHEQAEEIKIRSFNIKIK